MKNVIEELEMMFPKPSDSESEESDEDSDASEGLGNIKHNFVFDVPFTPSNSD